MLDVNKLLAKQAGEHSLSPNDWVEACALDSMSRGVVEGICCECGEYTDIEPDSEDGYCEECGENAVKSPLVIAGFY